MKFKQLNKSSIFIICALGICLIGIFSKSADAISNDQKSYDINENGETYGRNLPELGVPDLIEAEGVNGIRGYVKSKDLSGDNYKSPTEALEINQEKITEIPLYDKDGTTIIGVFYLDSSNN